MRVLFTTSSWAGHYFCMVPLGWALQAAGHEVRFACTPEHSRALSSAGLVPVPVLESLDMMYVGRLTRYADIVAGRTRQPGMPLHPLTGVPVKDLSDFDVESAEAEFATAYYAAVGRTYDAALAYARSWRPDLICYDVMAEEGAVVARELGVPSVYCAPGLFGTVDEDLGLDLSLRDAVNNAARSGAEPWSRDQIEYVIDPSPASALPPVGDAIRMPIRYVPYNGPGEMPEWTWRHRGARKRVCILWGRSGSGLFGTRIPALRMAIDAALAQDAEVALTAAPEQVAALGELPPGVRVMQDFPLHLILRVSDAVVHNGSDNALMNGAVAGIPQVALSLSSDQVTFGRRMAATGAVIEHGGLTVTAEQVHAAVTGVLSDPAYRGAAERLRDEMLAHPAPTEVVASLVGLALGAGVNGR